MYSRGKTSHEIVDGQGEPAVTEESNLKKKKKDTDDIDKTQHETMLQ